MLNILSLAVNNGNGGDKTQLRIRKRVKCEQKFKSKYCEDLY